MGIPLDEWQEQALEAAMGERTDGRWAAKFVGVSAPRQNGKSQLIVARALAGVLLFAEKMIIISAHETDTAREVWKRLIDVIESNPTLEKRVTGRMDAINREFVAFGNGAARQIIKLKARQQSGGRGFSADCLLLDEGQILGKRAWGSIVPTMSAMPNPQLWLFGTPPTEADDPFAFTRVRESAKAGKARHCWLEWSAGESDDLDDPATWAKANPAYGVRISYEACADDRAAMDDGQFCVERLGMWSGGASPGPFSSGVWRGCSTAADPPQVEALGLALDIDRVWLSLAASGGRDPLYLGAVKRVRLDRDRDAMLDEVERISSTYDVPVCIDGKGPAATLLDDLEARGVRTVVAGLDDYVAACADLYDAVEAKELTHGDHPDLNAAVMAAGWRKVGDRRVWSRRSGDVTMLEAATLAAWAVRESVYETRDLAVF